MSPRFGRLAPLIVKKWPVLGGLAGTSVSVSDHELSDFASVRWQAVLKPSILPEHLHDMLEDLGDQCAGRLSSRADPVADYDATEACLDCLLTVLISAFHATLIVCVKRLVYLYCESQLWQPHVNSVSNSVTCLDGVFVPNLSDVDHGVSDERV